MNTKILFIILLCSISHHAFSEIYTFECGLSAPFPGKPELILKQELPAKNGSKLGLLGYGYTDEARHLFYSGSCTYGSEQNPGNQEAELRAYIKGRASSAGGILVEESYFKTNGRVTASGAIRLSKNGLEGITYLVAFYSNKNFYNWSVQGLVGVSDKLAADEFMSGYLQVVGK